MGGARRRRRRVRRRLPPAAVRRCGVGDRGRAARPARRPGPDAAGRPPRDPGARGRCGRAAAARRLGRPRARPHGLLLRPRVRARASPRRSGSCGPAGRSRSSTSTPPCRRTAAWMRADLPRYDPAAVEAFFDGHGFTLRRVPTVWRFPDRATRDAVLRIEFGRDGRGARDRRHRRARDPGGLPAARAPRRPEPALTCVDAIHHHDRPARAAHRAGTVGGPVSGRGRDGRAQAGRGSRIGGAGRGRRRRLARRVGGAAERAGDGGARGRPRGHRVVGGPRRAAPADAGRGPRVDRDRRRRVVYLVAVGVGLVVLGATLLRATGRAELTVPLAGRGVRRAAAAARVAARPARPARAGRRR